jgi:polysaccharide export outer membrane protein
MARAQSPLDSAMLKPGDILRIVVWRHPDFSGEFPVGPDGSITHPLFRTVHVTDAPFPVVETRVRQFLSQYESEPAFVLSPLLRVFVAGAVRAPNTFTLPPGTTLVQAIALAGGPADDAQMEAVDLVRDGQSTALDFVHESGLVSRMTIRSGDQIVIPRKRSILRDVLGPVSAVIGSVAAVTSIIIQLSR